MADLNSQLSGEGFVSSSFPWLWATLAPYVPWVAVFWPQAHDQSVVVASHQARHPVGSLVTSYAAR